MGLIASYGSGWSQRPRLAWNFSTCFFFSTSRIWAMTTAAEDSEHAVDAHPGLKHDLSIELGRNTPHLDRWAS